MILGFSDHAANERTFLAWVSAGVAIIAFGFLVEKFNLFLAALASSASINAGRRLWVDRLAGPLGRYDGLALILVGIALIVIAALRFVRTARLISDPEPRLLGGAHSEVVLSAVLALLAGGFCVYLVLG